MVVVQPLLDFYIKNTINSMISVSPLDTQNDLSAQSYQKNLPSVLLFAKFTQHFCS